MTKNIKPQIRRCVKLLFFLVVLVIPLIFYVNCKRHYEFPKTTLSQFVLIPLLVFFCFTFVGQFRKAKNPFRLPLLLFLFTVCLSSLRAVNLTETLDSKYLIEIFVYVLTAHLIVAARFNMKDIHFYGFLLTVAAVLSAFYGIIQFYEMETEFFNDTILEPLAVRGEKSSPVAFQGNRNYSSEFYNLALPMTLALLFISRTWPSRIFYILCTIFIRYHILIAKTRATEVGLAVTIPVILLIFFWTHRKEWSRLVFWIILFMPIEKILALSVKRRGFSNWSEGLYTETLLVYFVGPLAIYIGYYFVIPYILHLFKFESEQTQQSSLSLLLSWAKDISKGRRPGYAPPIQGQIPATRKFQHIFLMGVFSLAIIFIGIKETHKIADNYHKYQIREQLIRLRAPTYSSFYQRWLGPKTLSYKAKHPDYVYEWRLDPVDPNADWKVPDFKKFIQDRVDQTFFWDKSITFRIEVYNSALAMIRDNIWLGIGVGNFKIVHDLYTSQLERFVLGTEVLARKVHDEYMTFAVEEGAFGLLALFWFQMVFLKLSFRIFSACRSEVSKPLAQRLGSNHRVRILLFLTLGVFAGTLLSWVSMVFGHSYTLPTSHFLLWSSLGILVCLYHQAFLYPKKESELEKELIQEDKTSLFMRLPGMANLYNRLGLATVLSLILILPIFYHWMGENFLQYGMQLRNWIDYFKSQELQIKNRSELEKQQYFQHFYHEQFAKQAPHLAVHNFNSFEDGIPGMIDQLFNYFDRSIEVWPFHMETYYILGRYCIDFQRNDLGIKALELDLFMNPNYKWAHNNLGVMYDQTGQDQAKKEKALLVDPTSGEIQGLSSSEYYAKARNVYYRALLIDPQQIFAHFNLAQGYMTKERNIPLAIQHLYGVIDSDPNRLDVYGKLAYCLIQEKQWEEAARILDDYFYRRKKEQKDKKGYSNDDMLNYQMLITVYRELNQPDQEFQTYEEVLKLIPNSMPIHQEYVRELLKNKHYSKAFEEVKKMSYLKPQDPQIQLQLAELTLIIHSSTEEALPYLKNAIRYGKEPIRRRIRELPHLAPLLEYIE